MKFLRARLEPNMQSESTLKVDRDSGYGVIRGASLATEGPALGHGFELDRETIGQVAEHFDDTPGRWTHGGLSEDGLGRHLGRWQNTSTREIEVTDGEGGTKKVLQAVGDFHFAKSAHKIRPDGLDVSAPEYLMERADEDPSTFGISVVARFAMTERRNEEGDVESRVGHIRSKRDARRADFVADPAANPVGLHAGLGGMSELHELAGAELPRLVRRLGMPEVRRRASALLDRLEAEVDEQEDTHPADEAEDDMELKEALAALDKKDAEIAVLNKSLAEKDKAIASLEKREENRVKERHEAYMQSLRDQAAAAKVGPFKSAELDEVAEALELSEKLGRKLGDAKLAALLATSEGTETHDLDDTPGDTTEDDAAVIARGGRLSEMKKG